MKHLTALLLTLAMTLALAGCGSPARSETPAGGETGPETAPVPEETPAAPAETAPADDGGETSTAAGPLIAYFSWSGNTEVLAGMIQTATGGDLFAIEPETPYTDDYNTLLDVAQQEQADNARPAVAATVDNWDEYDTVFVGYPNWWGDAPMIVLSFLESYDCAGKTIVPFATSGGGGFGGGIDSITGSAAGATILEGFHVSGDSVDSAQADVESWLSGLGY